MEACNQTQCVIGPCLAQIRSGTPGLMQDGKSAQTLDQTNFYFRLKEVLKSQTPKLFHFTQK